MVTMHLNPWHILVIAMAGWMNREQSAVVEYLREENRILRELLGKNRPRLNDDQRCRLAAKGKALGRKLLSFGLIRHVVFFVIELPTRHIKIAGVAPAPNGSWMN